MKASELKGIEDLAKFCGLLDRAPHFVVATTMWEHVPVEKGSDRERDLQDNFLNSIPGINTVPERFDNTFASARLLIGNLSSLNVKVCHDFGGYELRLLLTVMLSRRFRSHEIQY